MEINVSDLTTMDLQGDGAFDNIMTAMQTRLDREFKKNRLVGPEYAKVYLGSFEASLMNATQFVLGRQEAAAKADLLVQQVLTEKEQLKLVTAQVSKMAKEEQLIDGQIEKMKSEIEVMEQQVFESIQKVETMRASVWAERAKTNSDSAIFDPIYDPIGFPVTGLVGAQIKKSDAEGALIEKKGITEMAQTNDLVDTPPRAVSGVIGKQKALFQKQTDGFDRDAEQKLSKILVDTWNVRRTTDDNYSAGGTGLEDDQINNVLDIAKMGIGAPMNNPTYGISFIIHTDKTVYEDCAFNFSAHIELPKDWDPAIHISRWHWYMVSGTAKPSSKIALVNTVEGGRDPWVFRTLLEEPGDNVIGLSITLSGGEMDGLVADYYQTIYAIETETVGGVTPCPNAMGHTMTAEEQTRDDFYSRKYVNQIIPDKMKVLQQTPGYKGWTPTAENHSYHK